MPRLIILLLLTLTQVHAATPDPLWVAVDQGLVRAEAAAQAGQPEQAVTVLTPLLEPGSITASWHGLIGLRLARAHELAGDHAAALRLARTVAADPTVPDFRRELARDLADQVARVAGRRPRWDFATPAVPKPHPDAVELWVNAERGADAAAGTVVAPLASLGAARDRLRRMRAAGTLSFGAVVLARGTWNQAEPLILEPEDSGRLQTPIVWQAAGLNRPRLCHARSVTAKLTTAVDADLLALLPNAARDQARQVDLRRLDNGTSLTLAAIRAGGFASGAGFTGSPLVELWWDGEPLPLARWPGSASWATIGSISPEQRSETWKGPSSAVGSFTSAMPVPAGWTREPDPWLLGWWCWDWAEARVAMAAVDPASGRIDLAKPWPQYGLLQGQRWCALNVFSAIDHPGAWCLDATSGRLVVWPPGRWDRATVEVTLPSSPRIQLHEVRDVVIAGFDLDAAGGDGVMVQGGERVVLADLRITRLSGDGIRIDGGHGHQVIGGEIARLGRGGISLIGGDRRSLSRSDHLVTGVRLHHLGRIDATYTPAVHLSGVGGSVIANTMSDLPSSAIRCDGNEHRIERNDIARTVLVSDDQGSIDTWGDPTFRGTIMRWNRFTDTGHDGGLGQAAIRLDDAISGQVLVGNLCIRSGVGGFGAIQVHAGTDNFVEDTWVVGGSLGVSWSVWDDGHWQRYLRENAREMIASMAIDRPPFAERYPALANLGLGGSRNHCWGVTVWGERLWNREPAMIERTGGNRVIGGPMPDTATLASTIAASLAVPIPVEHLGAGSLRH